jgi:hypothetical protein
METNIPVMISAHWKRFVWIWSFPLAFLVSVFVPAYSRHPFTFFAQLIFRCSSRATTNSRDRLHDGIMENRKTTRAAAWGAGAAGAAQPAVNWRVSSDFIDR